jgi:hypothetical protein
VRKSTEEFWTAAVWFLLGAAVVLIAAYGP